MTLGKRSCERGEPAQRPAKPRATAQRRTLQTVGETPGAPERLSGDAEDGGPREGPARVDDHNSVRPMNSEPDVALGDERHALAVGLAHHRVRAVSGRWNERQAGDFDGRVEKAAQVADVYFQYQKDLKKKFDAIKEGKTYKAKVLGASEFGVFCEVEGVEGLIHISEISWEKVANAASFVTIGETIDVYVVEKNERDLKLNLSLKRLLADPWKEIEEKYPKDKEVEGEVVRKEKYGYFVRLEPGVEGLIHISKLTGQEDLKIGQKIKTFIERVSLKERRMSLVLPQKEKPVMYR